jgi:two-component system phosphate regulon sensor histidine kinase PhoR
MPRPHKLLWQLLVPYVLVVFLSIWVVSWYASQSLRNFFIQHTEEDLNIDAAFIEDEVAGFISDASVTTLTRLCQSLAGKGAVRITIMLPDGKVVGDSEEDPIRMDNHKARPEMMAALNCETGKAIRYSQTLGTEMLYLAIPLMENGELKAVLRTAVPLQHVEDAIWQMNRNLLVCGVMAAAISGLLCLLITHRITHPLANLKKVASQYARGNFENRIQAPPSEELAGVTEAMNQMAVQLRDRLQNLTRQRNELEAVLSSMVEAVLAFDLDECLINLNNAAAELLDLDPARVLGRPIQEIIRNADLIKQIGEVLEGQKQIEGDLTFVNGVTRYLQVHGSPLLDSDGNRIGALMVMNDVTRLRRLENVRRDFVANVSHEIRTPITSIKGFVETLQEGAINEPEEAKRFLDIVAKQANRLNSIIDDLLALSTIEQEKERGEVSLELAPIGKVIENAVQACASQASDKSIFMEIQCDKTLEGRINPRLLEQAVVNLINNAIKYSDNGKRIWISASIQKLRNQPEIMIQVSDEGSGIPEEHLPRLFERFYRVDKARSRKLGGTGLGLAIVKHIVQTHGGRVEASSQLNVGSVFTIALPVPKNIPTVD